MFDSLSQKFEKILRKLRGQGILTEEGIAEALKEVRVTLLEADVNFKIVKSFLDRVREKAIGQEELAKKSHIDRTTIARLECGIFKSLSMGRLERIAEVIGLDLKTLLLKSESVGESISYRGHFNRVEFTLDYPEEGFRIASLTPKRKEFFFGKIEIESQKTVPSTKLPHPEQIFSISLRGNSSSSFGRQRNFS